MNTFQHFISRLIKSDLSQLFTIIYHTDDFMSSNIFKVLAKVTNRKCFWIDWNYLGSNNSLYRWNKSWITIHKVYWGGWENKFETIQITGTATISYSSLIHNTSAVLQVQCRPFLPLDLWPISCTQHFSVSVVKLATINQLLSIVEVSL